MSSSPQLGLQGEMKNSSGMCNHIPAYTSAVTPPFIPKSVQRSTGRLLFWKYIHSAPQRQREDDGKGGIFPMAKRKTLLRPEW